MTAPSASSAVRISDVVKPFSGEGDVVQWLDKLEIVAELRGIADVSKLLPLFLEGPAFAVYREMDPDEKGDLTAIKRALTDAFSLNAFQAYEQLTRRCWKDEPVDVYLSDLRRLAKLAGVESDCLLRRAFVVGLPAVVSRELRALAKVDNLSLSSVVERARALMAEQVVEDLVAVSPREEAEVGCSAGRGGSRPWRCFRCGRPHRARNCTAARKMNCWTCGLEGHFARDCHSDSGNEVGKTGAPAVFPSTQ